MLRAIPEREGDKQIPSITFLALPLIFPSFRSEHNIASPRDHTPQHFPIENSIARDGSTYIDAASVASIAHADPSPRSSARPPPLSR
jgi:hypothetical protein